MNKQLQSIQVKLSKSGELRKQWITIIDKMKKLENLGKEEYNGTRDF